MTAAERAERTRAADDLCAKAFAEAGCPDVGVALVAVGGYGRQELAPFSDLDVVLVHDAVVETGDWAAKIWYPLWDSGATIDHSVRTVEEVLEQADADLRVATGMLDVRHLAGDPNLSWGDAGVNWLLAGVGNLVGAVIFVATSYWYLFLKDHPEQSPQTTVETAERA